MTLNLPMPSMSESGGGKNSTEEIRRYLFRLVDQLNNTDIGGINNTTTNNQQQQSPAESGQIAELKSLIVRNQKNSDSAIEELRQTIAHSFTDLGLSVSGGAICVTFEEDSI